MSSYKRLGALSVVLLVVLRMAVGWHFFYEGWWKYTTPTYSAEAYLNQAKGPFAETFQGGLPDRYGFKRLDAETMQQTWQAYADAAAAHYGFDEGQKQQAAGLVQYQVEELKDYLLIDIGNQDYQEYIIKMNKWLADSGKRTIAEIPNWNERHIKERDTLRAKAAPWLAAIDKIDDDFRYHINALATPAQAKSAGDFEAGWTELDWINFATTYGLLAIGICLLVGLFTRFASLCGAVFLLMVVLAQPALPWIYPPAHPSAGHAFLINKEFLEMLLLLFLATTHVGRWGGLDFFIHTFITRPLFGSKDKAKAKA